MLWDQMQGHQLQVANFRRAISRGRLSSAYLFCGTDGIGKKRFAITLAQCILCTRYQAAELNACGECSSCKQVMAGSHPDVILVERRSGKKFLSIDQFVGTDELRGHDGLCYQIALRPMMGDRRIAIIDNVELMNQESANSLLKTLEEPPAGAILFLISSNPQSLLPTILSRCQQVWFSPLTAEQLTELLVEQDLLSDTTEAAAVAQVSAGSLTNAIQLIHPELRALRTLLNRHLSAGCRLNSVAAAKQLFAHLEEMSSDAQEQRQNANWLVRYAAEFYHQAARRLTQCDNQPSESAFIEQFLSSLTTNQSNSEQSDFLEQIAQLADRVTLAVEHLERSMPVPLCLEALFADLANIARTAETQFSSVK